MQHAIVFTIAHAVPVNGSDGCEAVLRERTSLVWEGGTEFRGGECASFDRGYPGDVYRPANGIVRARDELRLESPRKVRFVHGDRGVVRETLVNGRAVGIDLEAREPGLEVAGERAGRDDGGGGG